jgi:recombination protein RecA
MSGMKFLKDFEKDMEKIDITIGSGEPPRYWYSTGNYVLNRIISGSFYKGIPQGRVTGLVGPSGAGKSFLLSNLMASAQREGAHVVAIDSENALDEKFVRAIGVNPDDGYTYVPVDTIPQVTKVVSSLLKGYKAEWGEDNPDAPQLLIGIDSLDMLMTDTEEANFGKGVTKGDQGQRNKQLKAMLRTFVQTIKRLNVQIVVTDGVYKNQDVMNGEGLYIAKEAIRFSLSQIIMLTKLKLRETGSTEVKGIRMKCEGFKTRFTKPFQKVVIEVPYDEGMDPYSGLKDVAIELGILSRKGAYYLIDGEDDKWYEKDIAQHADRILKKAEEMNKAFLLASGVSDDDVADPDTKESARSRRKAKVEDQE